MMRLRNCAMSFVSVVMGAAIINQALAFSPKVILAAFSASIVTGAGNIINDYFDYDIDKINRPKRPLPSMRIKKSDALITAIIMFSVGIGIAHWINNLCLAMAMINTAILIIYGKYSKKLYLWSNLMVAYLVASLFIYGALATQTGASLKEKIPLPNIILLAVLTVTAFFSTLAREIMKDIEDMEGDIKKYSVTIPIRLGPKKAKNMASDFLYIAIVLSFLPFILDVGRFNRITYGILILLSNVIFLYSLKTHPALSQRIMVVGMIMSLVAFSAGIAT